MIATIAEVAHELAQRYLADRDITAARQVIAKAQTIEPASEELWRDHAQAEAMAGNRDAVRRAHDRYFDQCADLGIEPDPETADLLDRLLGRHRQPA